MGSHRTSRRHGFKRPHGSTAARPCGETAARRLYGCVTCALRGSRDSRAVQAGGCERVGCAARRSHGKMAARPFPGETAAWRDGRAAIKAAAHCRTGKRIQSAIEFDRMDATKMSQLI
jgi:hypothetical protein